MTRRVMVFGGLVLSTVLSFDKTDVNGEEGSVEVGSWREIYVRFVSGVISRRFVRSNE